MEITIDLFTRYFLGAYFTFIAFFYSLKLILNSTGNSLTFVGNAATPHWFGHITFRFFRLAIWGICVARIFYPSLDQFIGIFPTLMSSLINLVGLVLIILGFALIFVCHRELKQHWRLGIDRSGPEHLVATGVYSKSRNPIFLGVLIGQVGFFLALPSVFSLVCLTIGVVTVLSQIRLEEKHLNEKLASAYQLYCEKVPRFW